MALLGKQKELDANDDGKISGEDFKMLQKNGKMKNENEKKEKTHSQTTFASGCISRESA